jgi:polysaccharide biosynthesis/export protein
MTRAKEYNVTIFTKKQQLFALMTCLMTLMSAISFGQASTETYRLQPEDVITIQVYRVQEINAVVPVGPDGNISAPFLGTIKAGGKTIKELEADLTAGYINKLQLNDPIVSVTIREYRRLKASVNGFVGRPGVYDIRPNDRLMDLLSSAGGTSTDGRADLSKAYLVKKSSGERIPIDIRALLAGDASQNYLIEDGDLLQVPEETDSRVVVAGRVRQEGPIAYRQQMKLSEVIATAGKIEKKSKLSKVQIFRPLPGRPNDFLVIESNMIAFEGGKDPSQNITMQPGDLVYIPDSGNIDFETINSIANVFFIFDRIGINPFKGLGG